jgi:hypothetical protein
MSCCGERRAAVRPEPRARPTTAAAEPGRWVSGAVVLEYQGAGRLTITGPVTGTVYRFGFAGSRVRVHGSDAPSLVSMPNVKLVR